MKNINNLVEKVARKNTTTKHVATNLWVWYKSMGVQYTDLFSTDQKVQR